MAGAIEAQVDFITASGLTNPMNASPTYGPPALSKLALFVRKHASIAPQLPPNFKTGLAAIAAVLPVYWGIGTGVVSARTSRALLLILLPSAVCQSPGQPGIVRIGARFSPCGRGRARPCGSGCARAAVQRGSVLSRDAGHALHSAHVRARGLGASCSHLAAPRS